MSNDQRRAAVTEALTSGTLPREQPAQVWAGNGTEKRCAACGSMLRRADVEFELEFVSGVSVILDRHCYAIWTEERTRTDGID